MPEIAILIFSNGYMWWKVQTAVLCPWDEYGLKCWLEKKSQSLQIQIVIDGW